MDTLLQQLFDLLDGKIEVSSHIEQIIQDENINSELREQLPTLDLNELSLFTEEFTSSEEDSEGEHSPEKLGPILEVIVQLLTRPVAYIQNDNFDISDPKFSPYLSPESLQKKLENSQQVIHPAIKASGKIRLRNISSSRVVDYFGTGWLVADNIIVTNRHVARLFAAGQDDNKGSFNPPETEVCIDFKAEHNNKDEACFKVESILYVQDIKRPAKASIYPDIAFLQVSDKGFSGISLPAPIPLSENPVENGREVVVIGYPGPLSEEDWSNLKRADPELCFRIFENIFGVKRLQPGQIRIDETKTDGRIAHDCTTLGGNSGSVVLDLETGKAVGIHFGGKYDFRDKNLNINYAVPASTIKELLDKIL